MSLKQQTYLSDYLKFIPALILFVSIIGTYFSMTYRVANVEAKTEKIEDSQTLFHKDTAENIQEIKINQAKLTEKVTIIGESVKEIRDAIRGIAKRPV